MINLSDLSSIRSEPLSLGSREDLSESLVGRNLGEMMSDTDGSYMNNVEDKLGYEDFEDGRDIFEWIFNIKFSETPWTIRKIMFVEL